MASSLKIGLRPRLPLAWPYQFMAGSSQISSKPCAFNAALYAFQFVVRYFLRAGFVTSVSPSCRRCAGRLDLCNKALLMDTLVQAREA